MPAPAQVDRYVPQGDVITVERDTTIGTTGLDNCVGLIVLHRDGQVTGAHFSKSCTAAAARERALKSLNEWFPPKEAMYKYGYASGNPDNASRAIMEIIDEFYAGLEHVEVGEDRVTDGTRTFKGLGGTTFQEACAGIVMTSGLKIIGTRKNLSGGDTKGINGNANLDEYGTPMQPYS